MAGCTQIILCSASWTNVTNFLRIIESKTIHCNMWSSSAIGTWSITLEHNVYMITYGILRITNLKGVTIIGYAADIVITVAAKMIDEVRVKAEETISTVKNWLRTAALCLRNHKTESVLLSSRKKVDTLGIRIGSHLSRSNKISGSSTRPQTEFKRVYSQ